MHAIHGHGNKCCMHRDGHGNKSWKRPTYRYVNRHIAIAIPIRSYVCMHTYIRIASYLQFICSYTYLYAY